MYPKPFWKLQNQRSKCILRHYQRLMKDFLIMKIYVVSFRIMIPRILNSLKLTHQLQINLKDSATFSFNSIQNQQQWFCLLNRNTKVNNSSCEDCLNCSLCCFRELSTFNLINYTFFLNGLEFKLIWTLAVTSVSCECSFFGLRK